jgi:hypothetical protein
MENVQLSGTGMVIDENDCFEEAFGMSCVLFEASFGARQICNIQETKHDVLGTIKSDGFLILHAHNKTRNGQVRCTSFYIATGDIA